MKIGTKYLVAVATSLVVFGGTGVFAESNAPSYLSQESTVIDVSVNDHVYFRLPANTNDATVDPVTVTNNLTSVPVVATNVQATAVTGYNLEAFNSSFDTFAVDSKHFGVAYVNEGNHDVSGTGYTTEEEIAAAGNKVFNFTGKSSIYSATISEASETNMLNLIFTLGIKEAPQSIASMQNFACSELQNIGDTTTLVDEREGGINSYIVGRAKDNKCWMLQNLKLGSSVATGGSITVAKTNNTTREANGTFELSGKVASGERFTYQTNNGYEYTNNSSQFACEDEYGCYYNWYATTAGSGLSSTLSEDAAFSICPAGWELPSESQYTSLKNAYGYSSSKYINATDAYNTTGAIPGMTLAGSYGDNGHNGIGNTGRLWTRTAYATGRSVAAFFIESSSVTFSALNKFVGSPVRCITN